MDPSICFRDELTNCWLRDEKLQKYDKCVDVSSASLVFLSPNPVAFLDILSNHDNQNNYQSLLFQIMSDIKQFKTHRLLMTAPLGIFY